MQLRFFWPPQPSFQRAILWLKDTGILNKLKDDVMNPPTPIPLPKVRHNQPLILRQLGITFIILALGLFIATLVFLREITSSRIHNGLSQHNVRGGKKWLVKSTSTFWLNGITFQLLDLHNKHITCV